MANGHSVHSAHGGHSVYPNGMSDVIKYEGNALRDRFLKETASGTLSFLASGFGKGLLAVAGIAVIGTALIMGGLAATGAIDLTRQIAPDIFQNVGKVGVLDGILGGAKMGLGFLTTPLGVSMAVGTSVVTGVSALRKEKREIAEATQKALERAEAKSAIMEMERKIDMLNIEEPEQTFHRERVGRKPSQEGYVNNENLRAANRRDRNNGIQGV